MSIITLQRLWFRTKQCLSANLEKEPFIPVDLLGKYSFENWAGARLQLHSTLSRYPGAVNKLHQPPNVWALHAPFSENALQAITPLASIWPDFWEVAPAAAQMAVPSWISLVTIQSDSQFHSHGKEMFVRMEDRSIYFNPSHKVSKFIILTQETSVSQKPECSGPAHWVLLIVNKIMWESKL